MKDGNRIRTATGAGVIAVLLTMAASMCMSQGTEARPGRGTSPDHLIISVKGSDLFRAYCASCHGSQGRGDGPIAPILKTPPSDLTAIARRNYGIFPAKRLEIIIAADDLIAAHGNREMPIWGPVFHRVEWDQDLGEVRLRNVIKYLESIQQK